MIGHSDPGRALPVEDRGRGPRRFWQCPECQAAAIVTGFGRRPPTGWATWYYPHTSPGGEAVKQAGKDKVTVCGCVAPDWTPGTGYEKGR